MPFLSISCSISHPLYRFCLSVHIFSIPPLLTLTLHHLVTQLSYTFGGKRTIERAFQNPFWRPQKVAFPLPPFSRKHPETISASRMQIDTLHWGLQHVNGEGDFCATLHDNCRLRSPIPFGRLLIYILEAEVVLGALHTKGGDPQKGSTLGSRETLPNDHTSMGNRSG